MGWTKDKELAYLDACIAHLTEERSYLGPALKAMRSYIDSCLRSDYFPDLVDATKEMEVTKKYLAADIAKANADLADAQARVRDAEKLISAINTNLINARTMAKDIGNKLLQISTREI